ILNPCPIAMALTSLKVGKRERGKKAWVVWVSGHKREPPPGSRTRRKFNRFSTGNANRRRIRSNSARSLSLRRAARAASRFFELWFNFFTQRFLKNFQHRFVSRPGGG